MISKETIEQIKHRMNIVDIVQDYIKLKKQGSNMVGLCPFHNEKTGSFTVSPSKGIYKCFGCGKSGDGISFLMEHEKKNYVEAIEILAKKYNISIEESGKKKEFIKPAARLEKLSKLLLDWFENKRKISNNTLLRFNITESKEWMPQFEKEVPVICFNYYRGDELVNIKFRGTQKSFKLAKDAELIFYNLNAIVDETECVIVEGEIDALTSHECGIYNVASVPNGTPPPDKKGNFNPNLEYLDNCWKYFENKTKIILATDNDYVGGLLKDELARRLGKEKCYTVTYPDGCKDLNDVLINLGKDAVKEVIAGAKQIPIEGIVTMDDMFPQIDEWFEKGYPPGAKAGIENFDNLLTFSGGQLTMITGIPGHGKDEFANWVMTLLAKNEQWPWGICGFEETPAETATKIIEKYVGKAFDFRIDQNHRISKQEYENGIVFVERYFHFINTEQVQTSLSGILEKAAELVKRKGIKGFCLNPWNWVEHSREPFMSETEYISYALTQIILFARTYEVHFILMAHPTKMSKKDGKKYDIPTLYSINGSANFFNKTHNGITVYRDSDSVDVHVQKVKQSWLGRTGLCQFTYNTYTRQYSPIMSFDLAKEQLPKGAWRPVADLPRQNIIDYSQPSHSLDPDADGDVLPF